MFTYYISFSHQAPEGLGIGACDYHFPERIGSAADLDQVRHFLDDQGYRNVSVLAFSLYAKPNTSPDRDSFRRTGDSNPGRQNRPRPNNTRRTS